MKKNKSATTNVQILDLVRFIQQSEPCLFNNSDDNLMLVTYGHIDIQETEQTEQ